jgi:hypothetical protein
MPYVSNMIPPVEAGLVKEATFRARVPYLNGDGGIPVHVTNPSVSSGGGDATEATLSLVKGNTDKLDITLSVLRDALRGTGGKNFSDVIAALASVPVTGAFYPATQPVSGTVSVGNFPANQAVTGTFYPATQPVSGTVSVGNFPATQPISGSVSVSNLPATQPVSGTVSVGNFPATQPVTGSFFQATQPVSGPLTDAQLRASSVPVSGPLTDAQMRASALPVSGAFFQATQPVSGFPANVDQSLRASGQVAVTATGNSSDFTNTSGDSAVFTLVVTAASGTTPTMVVKIQGKDPITSRYYDIPGAAFASQAAATAANTCLFLQVGPGLPVTAGSSANSVVPRQFRAVWTIGGTLPSFTFSLNAGSLVA